MKNQTTQILDVDKEMAEKSEWLLFKIKESIIDIGKKKRRNKSRASIIKISLLILSGGATILLGINLAGHEIILKNIAFIFSVSVTLLTALEPFFNYRILWVEQEQAKAKLHRLEDKLCFYLEGKSKSSILPLEIEGLNEEYQNIWEELSKEWIKERRLGSKNIHQAVEPNKLTR